MLDCVAIEYVKSLILSNFRKVVDKIFKVMWDIDLRWDVKVPRKSEKRCRRGVSYQVR